jgi:peptidoglycan/LPS O-acetylase OafA/YrhL
MLILFICTHRNQFGFLPIASVFLQNYLAPSKWLISWSLCVEEHFYIVLPVLVMITHNLNRWIIFLTALFFVFISSLLRFRLFPMMQISGYNSFIEYFYVPTHLRLDSLSLGVLLAALYIFKPKEWSILLQLKRSLAILGVIIVLFWGWSPWISGTGAAGLGRMQFLPAVPGFLVLGLGTSFIIPWAFTRAWTGRLADFAKLIAEYAYVLYLCHTPAIGLTVRVTKHSSYSFVASLALASATTAGMAFLLRNFIEVPALTLREKLLAPRPKSNAVST